MKSILALEMPFFLKVRRRRAFKKNDFYNENCCLGNTELCNMCDDAIIASAKNLCLTSLANLPM
jgi:hypothetical protein